MTDEYNYPLMCTHLVTMFLWVSTIFVLMDVVLKYMMYGWFYTVTTIVNGVSDTTIMTVKDGLSFGFILLVFSCLSTYSFYKYPRT